MVTDNVKFLICGDSAITVQFGETADIELNLKVNAFNRLLQENLPRGVIETLPTYRSLMVYYNPLEIKADSMIAYLKQLVETLSNETLKPGTLGIRIPVRYAPPGSEIQIVADYEKKSVEEIIRIHSSNEHYVFMLGFSPGNAYIGCPQKTFTIPRKATPTKRPYAGSVHIWSNQTGVGGGMGSVTGWYSLGRSPLVPYDTRQKEPFLFKPGMWIQFYPIDDARYEELEHEIAEMRYEPEYYEHIFTNE